MSWKTIAHVAVLVNLFIAGDLAWHSAAHELTLVGTLWSVEGTAWYIKLIDTGSALWDAGGILILTLTPAICIEEWLWVKRK